MFALEKMMKKNFDVQMRGSADVRIGNTTSISNLQIKSLIWIKSKLCSFQILIFKNIQLR